MDERYAEALEQQIALLRWCRSQRGEQWVNTNYHDPVFNGLLRGILTMAEPFYWSPEMCQVLIGSEATMPDHVTSYADLLTDVGYFWFATPLPMPGRLLNDSTSVLYPDTLQAFAWSVTEVNGEQRVVVFTMCNTQIRATGLPGLVYSYTIGDRLEDSIEEICNRERQTSHPDEDGYTTEDTIARLRMYIRYFEAAILLSSSFVSASPTRVPRATIRRLTQEKNTPPHVLADPTVRIVQLRRERPVTSGQTREVNWKVQWRVEHHWRKQWYPSEQRHKLKYIHSYWKGPTDAPIKPPSLRLFRVDR